MSIFGKIIGKVFNHRPAATSAPRPAAPVAAPAPKSPEPAAPTPAAHPPAAAPVPAPVDVDAVLTEMSALKPGGGGNWRTSIADLLRLLDLDNSLAARRELAVELGVRAGEDGSAAQNIALHEAVMKKLKDNGGIVPDSLRD